MTNSLSAYTPLESLLLFQYLSIYGVSSDIFGKISDLLKNDPQIKGSGNYEPGRLSRDALRDFFLRLLKEEARNEINNTTGADNDGIIGDAQSKSRKRKAPSPHLPTIQEALKDAHLIPQLISRLYSRYREHAIIEIREDERRYERLDRDIKDIENGQWDQKLQQQLDRGEFEEVLQKRQLVNGTASGQASRRTSPPAAAASRHDEVEPQPLLAKLSPVPPQAPSPQPSRSPGQVQLPPSQPPVVASPRPRTPQPPPSQYRVTSPAPHQSPYAQQPSNAASLRPVAGQSPGMPPPPLPPLPYTNQPSYGPHNGLRPAPSHNPYTQPTNLQPQVTPASGYYQPYPNQQAGYFPQAQYAPPVYPPPRGGVQLPPFQVSPQTPPTVKQQHTQQQSTHGLLKPVPPRPGETAAASSAPPRVSLTPIDVVRLLSTTESPAGSGRSTPSSTRWKPTALSGLPTAPRSPTRPSRSVSPVSDAEGTPGQSPPTVKPNARRTRSNQVSATRSVSATDAPGPARATRAHGRRARGGSTTSSVVGSSARGRTRSQSVISHASLDNESLTGRKVKHEPSTPMEITETVEGTPGSSGQPATRRSMIQPTSNKRKRDLRGTSDASDALEMHQPPIPATPKDKVLAVRNFSRIAMPIIENDIMSHKHASIFSAPVRDKDAHGYSGMIRRPQDTKSIKAAITAGSRAVNAAAAADESRQGGGPRDTSGVLLPISEDLVPPKGIVNSAQLEREIMRMFANAVMFNPGEDEVVQDAREMYESAAVSMANFRSAERTGAAEAERRRVEESEADELGPEDDGASTSGGAERGKRRRLA